MDIDTSTQEGDETYFDTAEKHLTISINRLDDVSEADLDRVGKKKRNIRHANDNVMRH